MKSTFRRPWPWLAGLAAITLAACGAPSSFEHPAVPPGEPLDVALARVSATEWSATYEAGGVVRAGQVAVVSSRIVAPILEVRVHAGDRVRRGQTLVVLDGRELDAHRTRATASTSGTTLALQAAQADVRASEAALTLARATFDRVKGLVDRKSATTEELDQATAALAGAEARLAGARARVAEAEQGIAAARAAEEAASVSASYTVLVSPFDGLVAARHADPGTLASPGLPLLTVEDSSVHRLEARVDEAHARWVTVGGEVDVRVDRIEASADAAWQRSRVSEIAHIDPERHSFLVKVDLPQASGARSGQFGRLRIPGPSRKVLTAPASAIVRRGQLSLAFAVDRAGVARMRMVSVGDPSGDQVEVLAGLVEGDRVVARPPADLEDGRPVRGAAAGEVK